MLGVGRVHRSFLCVAQSAGSLIHVYRLKGSFVSPVFIGDVGVKCVANAESHSPSERALCLLGPREFCQCQTPNGRLPHIPLVRPGERGGLYSVGWHPVNKKAFSDRTYLSQLEPRDQFLADHSATRENVFSGGTGFPTATESTSFGH